MKKDVMMPQMGESIAEGTVVKWLKKIGDAVKRDEPLFEISTDKVDAEIPSPTAGKLAEIKVTEGKTVPINTVVAVIETEAADGAPAPAPAAEKKPEPPKAEAPKPEEKKPVPTSQDATRMITPKSKPPEAQPAPTAEERRGAPPQPAPAPAAGEKQRSSPLVRKIAREHGIDVATLEGTGVSGRVTKQDILQVVEKGPAPAAAPRPAAGLTPQKITFTGPTEVVPMSPMRKKIAEHMVMSRRTSAHVTTVFDIDYHRVSGLRDKHKARYEAQGTKLTFMTFITKAVIDGLRAWPVVNASVDGDNIVYKKDINIGIAVALDWGLIVPVLKKADEKSLVGISKGIADLADRARNKKLSPDDVQEGTFTITNPGVFGSLFGTPIINQPQLAILGVGTIEKRVCVVDDMIAIRPKGYLAISYDHRVVDGAVADHFMNVVKKTIENFEEALL